MRARNSPTAIWTRARDRATRAARRDGCAIADASGRLGSSITASVTRRTAGNCYARARFPTGITAALVPATACARAPHAAMVRTHLESASLLLYNRDDFLQAAGPALPTASRPRPAYGIRLSASPNWFWSPARRIAARPHSAKDMGREQFRSAARQNPVGEARSRIPYAGSGRDPSPKPGAASGIIGFIDSRRRVRRDGCHSCGCGARRASARHRARGIHVEWSTVVAQFPSSTVA